MTKLIRDCDLPTLKAFIMRESNMYNWHEEGEESQEHWVERVYSKILEHTSDKSYDYVRIQSLSNMGLLDAELKLSCANWGFNHNLMIFLPPCINGGVGFQEESKGK